MGSLLKEKGKGGNPSTFNRFLSNIVPIYFTAWSLITEICLNSEIVPFETYFIMNEPINIYAFIIAILT